MNIKEKIALSKQRHTIPLQREGLFYKSYNEDAMVFLQRVRNYKVTTRFVKNVGANVYSIGFPASEVEKGHLSFEYTSGKVRGFNIHFKGPNGIEKFEKLNVICYLHNKVLHVKFPENEFGKAVISVYNITGQQILSRQTSVINNEIAFNASQSVYLVSITTNKGVFSAKVINR